MYTVTIVTIIGTVWQFKDDKPRWAIGVLSSFSVSRLCIKCGNQLILKVVKKPLDI
jgi:hypothetical protein